MPSICGVRRPSNAQSIVGLLNYLGFEEGLPFEGLMSSNVIQLAVPAGTTTVSPSTVIRQLASRSYSGTTFSFKRAVKLNWLNQPRLHNCREKRGESSRQLMPVRSGAFYVPHPIRYIRRNRD